jgi:hypothetical protein
MPNRTGGSVRGRGWPLTRAWTALVVLLAAVFAVLRGLHAIATPAEDTAIFTEKVVVVGVAGRYQLTDTDRAVLGANLGNVQAGAVSVRPRYIGDCAAAGWATLGAGRRTGVGTLCDPQVQGRRVVDWPQRQAVAAAQRGDARLGTLAGAVPGCVAAVGPEAALAAARPDGTLAAYRTASGFLAGGSKPSCPLTLIDGGKDVDAIIRSVARQPDVTLFVTGIGPTAGSHDPGLQLIYRVGTTLPGWLTSLSTRREGIVTLADLTRTLIDFGQGHPATDAGALDGAPLQVDETTLTVAGIEAHLASVAAISKAAVTGYATLAVSGSVLAVLLVLGIIFGRFRVPRLVLALSCVLGAAMMVTGAVHWYDSSRPGLLVGVVVAAWSVVLTAAAVGLSKVVQAPVAVAGAGLTVAAFTVEAALGGLMEPGSLLNSRPVVGGRWYGYGNVTFAVYAAAGLVLAGYLAHRFLRAGRRVAALVSVALIGFGVVTCEGWPTMGTDFGGVVSLMPGVLWLLLVLSGVRITWAKLLALAGGAVAAISTISYLDWRRGPDARSHLGNFVQRVIDGDATEIVSRKGVTAFETVASPVGIGALVVGILVWVVLFRRLLPVLSEDVSTLRAVAGATLATAVLGTLLNDGGIYVWLTITASFAFTVASLWIDRALADGHLTWVPQGSR